jgi:hypothetical protein
MSATKAFMRNRAINTTSPITDNSAEINSVAFWLKPGIVMRQRQSVNRRARAATFQRSTA